jgi:plasmid maintenance system antidote protein VapI
MDNMLEHPWTELQLLIKEKWLTQKAFASILWKKVSEVNELLKWKRNITIQRDYLLHQTLWTPIKYWILKQIDYDYSLLDIEETTDSPLLIGEGQGEVSSHQASHSEPEWRKNPEISPLDKGDTAKPRGFEQPQETPAKEPDSKNDEDLQNRANIFRTF